MSKKKGKKVVQMLSPENYIRKRSRTLPIYKCWVMNGWEEIGKTHIIVSRKHVNGNITYCFYLVDLFCLGVKDTFFNFNIDETDLMEKINKENQEVEFKEISYTLAHNIIFSAIEFAEEYGFQPHKDFTRTTKYFLEEDDDKIEYMDIECGRNGKPLFIDDGEDEFTAKKIINQLEKTAGEGNFDFIQAGFDDVFDSQPEDQEQLKYLSQAFERLHEDLQKKVSGLQPEDIYKIAQEYDMESDDIYEIENAISLRNYCLMFYTDPFKIDQYLTQFEDIFADIDITDEIIEKMVENKNHQTSLFSDEILEIVSELDEISFNDSKNISEERMDEIINKYPHYPVLYYYKFINIDLPNNNENKINDYINSYTDATLLRIQYDRVESYRTLNDVNISDLFSRYFFNRKQLHSTELYELLLTIVLDFSLNINLEGIVALELFLENDIINEYKEAQIVNLITQIKDSMFNRIVESSN